MIQELLYKMKLEDIKKHVRGENEYYVSDLIRCPRKIEYEKNFPELVLNQAYDPTLLLGDIVHLGLETFLKKVFGEGILKGILGIEVEKKQSINKYIIRGRIDALIELESGKRIGVEIKYSRRDIGLPHQHHVLQVKIYNWLYDLSKSILIYITPNRITEYDVEEKASEEEILSLIEDKKSPRWPWECQYCRFAILCPYKKT